MTSLKINKYQVIGLFFVSITILFIIAVNIITGTGISKSLGFIFGIPVIIAIIINPINGLLFLPIVSNLIPRETNFTGIAFLSPGLIISSVTIISIILNRLMGKIRLKFSKIFIVIFIMIILLAVKGLITGTLVYFGELINYIQGSLIFFLFILTVNNNDEGIKIIKVWTIVYGLFCIKHLVFGATTDLDGSIQDNLFKQVYNLRVYELGAFNINVLTWIALLYIPISISFIRTGRFLDKILLTVIFISLMSIIIFTGSRASFAGILITLFLLLFAGNSKSRFSIINVMFIIFITFVSFFIWNQLITSNIFGAERNLASGVFNMTLNKRLDWFFSSIIEGLKKPVFGHGVTDKPFHSALGRSLYMHGIFHTIMIYFPLFTTIKYSFKYLPKCKDRKTKDIMKMILVGSIVALPESFFGITLYSSGYSQLIWIFAGFMIIVSRGNMQLSRQLL